MAKPSHIMNTPLNTTASPAIPVSEVSVLQKLVEAARPFLKINGADRLDWQRVMQDEADGRRGPWRWRARVEVLAQDIWARSGEVLYFVTDRNGGIKAVGQSKNKLSHRWKLVPMSRVADGSPLNQRGLFHTTAWPAIERDLDLDPSATYIVRALFREELEKLCQTLGGPLSHALAQPETPMRKLSFHVESWVCGLKRDGLGLWNLQKTGSGNRTLRRSQGYAGP